MNYKFTYQWSGGSPWAHCLFYIQCGHTVNIPMSQEEGARATLSLPACVSPIAHNHTSVAPLSPPIPRWPAELHIVPSTFSYSLLSDWLILPMPCWWYIETLQYWSLMSPTMAKTNTQANLLHSFNTKALASELTISADGKEINIFLLPLILSHLFPVMRHLQPLS